MIFLEIFMIFLNKGRVARNDKKVILKIVLILKRNIPSRPRCCKHAKQIYMYRWSCDNFKMSLRIFSNIENNFELFKNIASRCYV